MPPNKIKIKISIEGQVEDLKSLLTKKEISLKPISLDTNKLDEIIRRGFEKYDKNATK